MEEEYWKRDQLDRAQIGSRQCFVDRKPFIDEIASIARTQVL